MANVAPGPVTDLLTTAQACAGGWLRSLAFGVTGLDDVVAPSAGTVSVKESTGDPAPGDRAAALEDVIATVEQTLGSELERLLAMDVDDQRTTPLTLFRNATVPITAWLADHGYPPRPRSGFEVERFPADIYGLMPATWEDIHPDLVSVGLAWGAWKAMTVIGRRRATSDAPQPDVSPD